MLSCDFSYSLENIDLDTDLISFHLFETSAVEFCNSKVTSGLTRKKPIGLHL